MNKLREQYFAWICERVHAKPKDTKLLYLLDDVNFTYMLPLDGNRYEDGVDLRYRFGYDARIPDAEIAIYVDDHPCSILEMMVALSLKIEEQFMDDPDKGDRLYIWFWGMVDSLGIADSVNPMATLTRFLQRKYAFDGKGGLFTIPDVQEDMRKVEIWDQAMWYLNIVIEKERRNEY